MQALIDFDGWRKWKDFSQLKEDESKKAAAAAVKTKKNKRMSLGSNSGAPPSSVAMAIAEEA